MNVTFINCGYDVEDFVPPRNLFPSLTKQLLFYTTRSSQSPTPIFKNSPGYAMI